LDHVFVVNVFFIFQRFKIKKNEDINNSNENTSNNGKYLSDLHLPRLFTLNKLTLLIIYFYLFLLFIYYATKAAHDNTTYKARKIIHNKTNN